MANVIDLTDESTKDEPNPIDLDSDSEDEQLKLAIAISLQDGVSGQTEVAKIRSESLHANGTESSSNPPSLLGLDRKAMEAERLARLKRKHGVDDEVPSAKKQHLSSKVINAESARDISPPPIRRTISSRVSQKSSAIRSAEFGTSQNPFAFAKPKLMFTSTPSRHSKTDMTSISFRDIVAPPQPGLVLKSALLSSFIADFDWILPHFDTRSTSFVFVLHAFNPQHREALQKDFVGIPNVRLIMPPCLGGSGNMHSKVMLLFFKSISDDDGEICRVVVSSANLIPADWGVGQVMENVLSVVDLPVRRVTTLEVDENVPQFQKQLVEQLRAMQVPEQVLTRLGQFDFSATNQLALVCSMSQSKVLESSSSSLLSRSLATTRTGLFALSDAVASLGLSVTTEDPSYPPTIDYLTSSLGNLSQVFVQQLFQAVCGHLDPSKINPNKKSTARGSKTTSADQVSKSDTTIRENLNIYFPTQRTVRNSRGGPQNAGTICFQRAWWEKNDLIRQCLRDCIGAREDGILMHSKIMYVRFRKPKIIDQEGQRVQCHGWVYLGSANLSESAWGRITHDAKSKQPKLTCRNWESGVVVPIVVRTSSTRRTDHELQGEVPGSGRVPSLPTTEHMPDLSTMFSGVLPVPFKLPAETHVQQHEEPWFFKD